MIIWEKKGWQCDNCGKRAGGVVTTEVDERAGVPVGWFHVSLGVVGGAPSIEFHLCSSYCLSALFQQE